MKAPEMIRLIEARGWILERTAKGSHLIYRFPPTNAMFTLPFRLKDSCCKCANMISQIKRKEQP